MSRPGTMLELRHGGTALHNIVIRSCTIYSVAPRITNQLFPRGTPVGPWCYQSII